MPRQKILRRRLRLESFGVLWPIVLTALLLCSQGSAAQARPGPFESLDLAVHGVTNVDENVFHDYWDPAVGLEVAVTTPFYLGSAGLGGHLFKSRGRSPEVPDFQSLFLHAAWRIELPLADRLRTFAGVRLGLVQMMFDVDSGRFESEVAAGAEVGLMYAFLEPWTAVLSARSRTTFTRERWRMRFLALGVARQFRMPMWLRDFLL